MRHVRVTRGRKIRQGTCPRYDRCLYVCNNFNYHDHVVQVCIVYSNIVHMFTQTNDSTTATRIKDRSGAVSTHSNITVNQRFGSGYNSVEDKLKERVCM